MACGNDMIASGKVLVVSLEFLVKRQLCNEFFLLPFGFFVVELRRRVVRTVVIDALLERGSCTPMRRSKPRDSILLSVLEC